MKENEAPEKIYLFENPISGIPDDRWISKRSDENDIEYIRTNAFIEKAEKFLEDKLTEKECKFNWGDWTKVKSGDTPIASFIRAFRIYMKGE